jgi:hypothetical protein
MSSNKISRRHFLINGAAFLGVCFVPISLVNRATEYQKANNKALIEAPTQPKRLLYANSQDEGWQFSLGAASTDFPQAPSWLEYFTDIIGLNYSSTKEFQDWLYETSYELDEPFDKWIKKDVDYDIWDDYIDGAYAIKYSPEAQAFHYLNRLDLSNERFQGTKGEEIGDLEFYDGPMPGNNWHFVNAKGNLTLTALQHRLLELGENTQIIIT